jgi:hypothetical protein
LLCENTFKQLSRSSTSTTLLALEGGVDLLVNPRLEVAFMFGALERQGGKGSAGSMGIVNMQSSTMVNNSD